MKMIAIKKNINNLKVWSVEIPNAPYSNRYQTTYKDNNGEYLDGNKTYKLRMLPNVPALKANDDSSIDIYFANELPDGVAEQNWVQTLPNKSFFVYIRYYGPTKEYHEKTWIPNDVELVN